MTASMIAPIHSRRPVRFGAASAHGKANMIRFNFFERVGAFRRDPLTGRYSIDADKMGDAVASRKLDQTKPVTHQVEAHGFGVDCDRPVCEHACGEVFFVKMHCHGAAP